MVGNGLVNLMDMMKNHTVNLPFVKLDPLSVVSQFRCGRGR